MINRLVFMVQAQIEKLFKSLVRYLRPLPWTSIWKQRLQMVLSTLYETSPVWNLQRCREGRINSMGLWRLHRRPATIETPPCTCRLHDSGYSAIRGPQSL